MASTSVKQYGAHESIEQCNTQTTWLVPTKYKLHWKIENVCDFKEFKCPKMSGPAGTKFTVFLRMEDTRNYFVEMDSVSDRGPLKIKGEISVNNAEYLPIKRSIKKGFDTKKLQTNPVSVQENNTLEVRLEFIAFPVLNQFLKVNKNAAQFGEKLKDFVAENIAGRVSTNLADCVLYTESETIRCYCHKAILAARSPKLDTCLENSDSVQISVFQNCDDSILQGLLDYLYMANPYNLIGKYSFREVKEIVTLGQILEISEIDSLFEEREFSIISKSHNCGTMFEATMTNKDFFQLKSEMNAKIEFPNFTFCRSEWNVNFVKKRSSENEKCTIVLRKVSKENVTNIEVHVSYLNLQKEWVKLQKVTSRMEADDKKGIKKIKHKYKKRKCLEVKGNTHDRKKNDFEFEIENEFLQELFKSPISSQAETFKKLVLKCEIKHKKFYDNIDLKVKTLDAFRFLYDRQHFNGLSADLRKLYDSKKYTDLKIKVTSSSLYAREFEIHKIILAARSNVFKRKINESNDGKIEIEADMCLLENFDQIVCFMYTNEIDFNVIPPLKVYEFAFINSVIDLMNSARIYITEHLSERISTNAVKVAIVCNDEIFKESVKNYMSKHHSKKWDPETNEFISKPENLIARSHKNMNTKNLLSRANEIMDTNGSDCKDSDTKLEITDSDTKLEITDDPVQDDTLENESSSEE